MTDTLHHTPSDVWTTNGRGQRLIPPADDPDGKPIPYQRTSTFANTLRDGASLSDWLAWKAVTGALSLDRADPTLNKIRHATDTPRAAVSTLAEIGGSKDKARIGQRRHEVIAMGLAGVSLDGLPDQARIEATTIITAIRSLGTLTHTEAPIVTDRWKTAGSADYILTDAEGRTVVADLKTGRYLYLTETAVQLAAYAAGHHFDGKTRTGPVVAESARLVIVWAPQDGSTVRLVELDPHRAMETARLAAQVRETRREWERIARRESK